MNREGFNPYNPEYEKTEHLPEEHQGDFKDVEGGGFVKKEAANEYDEAQKLAEIARSLKVKGIKTTEDILRPEAEEYDRERTTILEKLKDPNQNIDDIVNSLKVATQFRDDKEVFLGIVKRAGKHLFYASEKLKDDKEVVLAAMEQCGKDLEYASDRLKDDPEVVLAAIKQDPDAYQYASNRIQHRVTGVKLNSKL